VLVAESEAGDMTGETTARTGRNASLKRQIPLAPRAPSIHEPTPNRRAILTDATAAATAAPQVFAQAQQAGAGLPAGAKFGFYEKGRVRIRSIRPDLSFGRDMHGSLGGASIQLPKSPSSEVVKMRNPGRLDHRR
jgi:hypothetical protein